MGSDRQFIPASEFCLAVKDGTHDSPKPVESGRFLVTSRHITSGRLDLASAYRIAQSDFEQINQRSRVDRWDVLISMIGTVGEPCLIAEEPNFAIKNVGLFKSRSELHGKWLYYYLRSAAAQQKIHELSRGTTQSYVPLGALRNLPVPVPADARELAAIAHILGSLDDKIELNRKLNKTLEDMARALFQSWFVDFDPVRAKALGLQPSGMDADTQKLFPDGFEMSELGEIPRGWRFASLSEAAELNPPRPIPKGIPAPYVEMASLPTTGHRPSEWPLREVGSGARFQNGDTLLARITPCLENGKTGYVDFLNDSEVAWGSTEYIVMRSRAPLPPAWTYLLARDPVFREFAAQKMEGTSGRQRVSADSLGRYKVAIPSSEIGERFGIQVQPLFQQMGANEGQNRTLASIRDALLPRLLSGEIPIKNAERFIASQG